jgi:RNA polymerase sigma-70 factor (ECF subfamily)
MRDREAVSEAEFRPLLFSIAYGMTGSVGDAEDIVQDAFFGLTRARQAGADSLSMAFLVLLEALSPVERAVFMLREVFGYGYPDMGRIIGKTEVNCRQIFARARHRIAAGGQPRGNAPSPARRAEGEELARRFFEAAAGGDMDALLGMLAPDVVFHGDGGGKAQTIAKPLAGQQRIVRLLASLLRRGRLLDTSLRLAWVNGQPGAVLYDAEGRVAGVVELDVADGVVQTIRAVVNPDKLRHIGRVSDRPRPPVGRQQHIRSSDV